MTDFDLERFGGKRVHLFIVQRQSKVLRYCTGKDDFENGGHTYIACQIERSAIKETVERAKDKITVKFGYLRNPNAPLQDIPPTQELGDWWNPYPPSDAVRITCLSAHRGSDAAPKVEWMGIVKQPEFTDVECTLTCKPGPSYPTATNQGPKWQTGCWKTPYSHGRRGCGMQLDDFEVPATLTGAAGGVLTAAAFGTAPLSLLGGWIEWTTDDGLIERRTITAHNATSITVQFGAPDLVVGLDVSAWPNCELTWEACGLRFPDPQNHFGGARFRPIKNPSGDSMSWG